MPSAEGTACVSCNVQTWFKTYLFSGDHRLREAAAAEFECRSWYNEEVADKPQKHTSVL